MLGWASQQFEKLSQAVAPPPEDANGRFVYCLQKDDEDGAMACVPEMDAARSILNPTRGSYAIHLACQNSMDRLIRLLLTQPGVDLTFIDSQGNTPMHYACMSTNKSRALTTIKMLVTEFKASVAAKNSYGQTPYDFATLDMVRQYLLPIQLQAETQEAIDNGGVGLPPGIDMGGLRISNPAQPPPPTAMPPPNGTPQMASHSAPAPAPMSMPSQHHQHMPQSETPSAPTSGQGGYARCGGSSAAIYKPTDKKKSYVRADGFHSSSSDVTLQRKYGHVPVQGRSGPPPPSSGNSAGGSGLASPSGPNPFAGNANPYTAGRAKARYVAYDAVTGTAMPMPPAPAQPMQGYGQNAPPAQNFSTFTPSATPDTPAGSNVFTPGAPNSATPAASNVLTPGAPNSVQDGAGQQAQPQDLPQSPKASGNQPYQQSHGQTFQHQHQQQQQLEQNIATDASLPPGWMELKDEASGRFYYVHQGDNITTWDRPAPLATKGVPATVGGMTEAIPQQHEQSVSNDAPLPPGWIELKDEASGQFYYVHQQDNVSTWDRPAPPASATEKNLEAARDEKKEIPQQQEQSRKNDAMLPPGWMEVKDEASGQFYYVHHEDNITTWDRPAPPESAEEKPEPSGDKKEEILQAQHRQQQSQPLSDQHRHEQRQSYQPQSRNHHPQGQSTATGPYQGAQSQEQNVSEIQNQQSSKSPAPLSGGLTYPGNVKAATALFSPPADSGNEGSLSLEASQPSAHKKDFPPAPLSGGFSATAQAANAAVASDLFSSPSVGSSVPKDNHSKESAETLTSPVAPYQAHNASPAGSGCAGEGEAASARELFASPSSRNTPWQIQSSQPVKIESPSAAPYASPQSGNFQYSANQASAADAFSARPPAVAPQRQSPSPSGQIPARQPVGADSRAISTVSSTAEELFSSPSPNASNQGLAQEASQVFGSPYNDSQQHQNERNESPANSDEVLDDVPLSPKAQAGQSDHTLAAAEPSALVTNSTVIHPTPAPVADKPSAESLFDAIGMPPPPFSSSKR